MRIALFTALSSLALAACSPEMPNDAAPANAAGGLPAAAPVSAAPLDGSGAGSGADIAAETAAVLGVGTPAAATPAPATGAPLSAMAPDAATSALAPATVEAGAAQPGAAQPGAAQMSDEQSFAAVSERETIASDAARIEANRAQYVVIEPTDLPPRPDGTGASIVAYALATTNVPGQALYRRTGIAAKARFEASCAKYGGADRAQEAFLDAGGPKRDRYGMDPDGDGFACYWDPRPFRVAQQGAPEVVTEYEVIETPGVE